MGDGSASRIVRGAVAALAIVLAGVSAPRVAAAEEAGTSFLAMYFSEEEMHVLAATRSLKSIEHVAENVTVVTADDIRLMNAHTLSDVLEMVPGFHVVAQGSFGAGTTGQIFGSDQRHVLVLWDGVPLNNLTDELTALHIVPVTDVARIEVVKGPASSAWGSALGGVVNIVTIEPGRLSLEGEVRASYGSEASGDYRFSITGRKGRFGYFLAGTRLESDGLTPGFDVNQSHVQAHATLDLGAAARLRLDASVDRGDRGDGESAADDLDFSAEERHHLLALGATSALGGGVEADLAVWTTGQDDDSFLNTLSDGTEIFSSLQDQRRTGGNVNLSWKGLRHSAVAGVDASRSRLDSSAVPDEVLRRTIWAPFANATLDFGRFTLSPGLRYDHVSDVGSVLSPSLGATYAVAERALLRATVARGFSSPSLFQTKGSSEIYGYLANSDLEAERVWSYEVGVESDIVRKLWVKLAVFRHDVEDALTPEYFDDDPVYAFTYVNAGRQRRDGVSVEWRTAPWRDLSFEGCATWVRAIDLDTDEPLLGVPNQEFQLGLKYDDRRSVQALVQGHYFREHPVTDSAVYRNMLVDVHARKRVLARGRVSFDVFASAHNVFDGRLSWVEVYYPTPGRWFEAGISATF